MSDRTENWPHRVRPADDPPLSLDEIDAVVAQYPAAWRMSCLPIRRGEECACRGCFEAMRLTRAEQDAWILPEGSVAFIGKLTAEERQTLYDAALADPTSRIDTVQRTFRRALTPEELAELRDHPLHQDAPTNG